MQLLVDTDPGHDDLIAIALAADVADLRAITVVSGNAPLVETTVNSLVAADLVGFDGPIVTGADRPRARTPQYATAVHGRTGLDGAPRPEPARAVTGTDAARAIVDHADADTWVVAIGPLTNVAAAIELDPSLPGRVAGISIMGGAVGTGNVTAAAEFNVWTDPEAADIVLRSGARLVMCGLDLTTQIRYDEAWVDGITQPYVAALLRHYLGNHRYLEVAGAPLHDPCAVLAVTHPALFEFEERNVRVECTGELTRGMTVVDLRPGADQPNVLVARQIDAGVALELVRASVNRLVR